MKKNKLVKPKNKNVILSALFCLGIFLMAGLTNAFYQQNTDLFDQYTSVATPKPTTKPVVVPKMNTCYRPDGTSFKTTANCNEFTYAPTPTPKAPANNQKKTSGKMIKCNTAYGIIMEMTQEQCNEFHRTWPEKEREAINAYNNQVNTSPSNTYVPSKNYDYNYDSNYKIAPPPSYAPAPSFKPVNNITSPGINVNFATPVPTPKDCYTVQGGHTICL